MFQEFQEKRGKFVSKAKKKRSSVIRKSIKATSSYVPERINRDAKFLEMQDPKRSSQEKVIEGG